MPASPAVWAPAFLLGAYVPQRPGDPLHGQLRPSLFQSLNGDINVDWNSTSFNYFEKRIYGTAVETSVDPSGSSLRNLTPLGFDFLGYTDFMDAQGLQPPDDAAWHLQSQSYLHGAPILRLSLGGEKSLTIVEYPGSYTNEHLARYSSSYVLVTFDVPADPANNPGSVGSVRAKFYDRTSDTLSSELTLFAPAAGAVNSDLAQLASRNLLLAVQEGESGDSAIAFRKLGPTGANVQFELVVSGTQGDGVADTKPAVTGLAGDAFAIAWHTDNGGGDVAWRRYGADGAQTAAGTLGAVLAGQHEAPRIATLADGTFVILAEATGAGRFDLARYDATGAFLGSTSFAGKGDASVASLADGRFAVTWRDTATEQVSLQIFDTRDVIGPPIYGNVNGSMAWQFGTAGDDVYVMQAGVLFDGGAGDDTITGTAGADRVAGGLGADKLFGLGGNDIMSGGDGADGLDGGDGDDTIYCGAGNDGVYGGAGKDLVAGEDGDDALLGRTGDDVIVGGAGADRIWGDEDNDTLLGQAGADVLYGGLGNDAIAGGDDLDVLYGEDGADILFGGAGGDALYGGAGNDIMLGEDNEPYTIADADALYGGAGDDTMVGQGGDDGLSGDAGNDALAGGAGADWIFGGDGDDIIAGGVGGDTLYGGAGADLFIFASGDNGDYIGDFNVGGTRDTIDLRPLFDAYGYTGVTPRQDGALVLTQNGADTDIYVSGGFLCRLANTVAAGIDDSYFAFQ